MGKRSNYKRKKRDLYKTPNDAVIPLLPLLAENTDYVEPCAGDGCLIRHLRAAGHWACYASDIKPLANQVTGVRMVKRNFFDLDLNGIAGMDDKKMIITNPPWDQKFLKPMLDRILKAGFMAWLLLPADYMHNVWMAPYMSHCKKVVSIGRVQWFPGSAGAGFENSSWYLFQPQRCATRFHGRKENGKAR